MGRDALTAKEWWDKGYRIIRGEKHRKRNKKGVCVFYADQVRVRGFMLEDAEEYSDFDEGYDDPFVGEWGS